MLPESTFVSPSPYSQERTGAIERLTFPNERSLTLINNIQAPAKFEACNGIPGKTGGAAGQGGQSGTQRNTRRRINSPLWPKRQVSNMRREEHDLRYIVQVSPGPTCMNETF